MSPWDHPQAAARYEKFCHSHPRYIVANAALVERAQIGTDMCVLDLGAGTGLTTEASLPLLGVNGRVLCVEPSTVMRLQGMRRINDPRVQWSDALPGMHDSFDRILCGAAIWQLQPHSESFGTLQRLLRSGGALCFNIPALYLQEPDEAGGGEDPLLLALPTALHSVGHDLPARDSFLSDSHGPLSRRAIDSALCAANLHAESWHFRVPLTQRAYAEWLKIPAASDGLLPGLSPDQRAMRIDAALAAVDHSSWKWEHWHGWTAWKH